MKAKLLAAALLLAAPANATTYTYEGGLYGYANPVFGSRMTGTVTFDFDTSDFTGIIYFRDPSVDDFSLTSGDITTSNYSSPRFVFSDGSITGWMFNGEAPCPSLVSFCYVSSINTAAFPDIFPTQPARDFVLDGCHFCPTLLGSASGRVGAWTMVTPFQVPAPAPGGIVPGLILACLWAWGRWKQQ